MPMHDDNSNEEHQPLVDVEKLALITDANEYRKEIGNAIYPFVFKHYGMYATVITGKLLSSKNID